MKIFKFGCLVSIIVSLYCGIANTDIMYDYIFLIPFAYTIGMIVFIVALNNKRIYGLKLIFYIAHTLIYIRYVVSPFFTVFTSEFTSWGWGPDPSYKQILMAEILMCIEIWFILLVQYVAIVKFSKRKYTNKIQYAKSCNYEENILLLLIFSIVAFAIVILVQPSLLVMDEYFIYTGEQKLNDVSMQGMFVILADTFKKVFIIISLIICKKGYDKKNNKVFLLLAVIAVAINMALNSGGTRIKMIFALILGAYFLHYIFGKIPKIFYVAGFLLCGISFISVSVVKFSYAIAGSYNPINDVLTIMLGQFQDYFAGPRLVGQMIDLNTIYEESIGISTFFNDFLGSVPILSNYIDQTNRINYYFNIYNHMRNQTLIAPILGIGYCYCPIFPFFFTMIFEYYVIKLDYCMAATNKITYKYLYAYMGYICAMCMGYSTQNIYAEFISTFVPLFIVFKINNTFKIRIISNNKKKEGESNCGKEVIQN